MKRHIPINSLGRPYAEGDTWRCEDCGDNGPDRDDVAHPGCKLNGYPGADPHSNVYTTAGKAWHTEWSSEAERWVKVFH